MMISTRGRYALRVLIDLAQHAGEGCVPLKAVSQRQGVSLKYLESIVALLTKGGLLVSTRGKEGGYKLNRAPADYSIGEILRCIEDNLAPVACIKEGSVNCDLSGACLTIPMWKELDDITNAYLDTVSLEDLLTGAKWKSVD